MTHQGVWVPARLLLNRRIGALLVLKDEKVVGIITETDMIRVLIDLEEASSRSLGRGGSCEFFDLRRVMRRSRA